MTQLPILDRYARSQLQRQNLDRLIALHRDHYRRLVYGVLVNIAHASGIDARRLTQGHVIRTVCAVMQEDKFLEPELRSVVSSTPDQREQWKLWTAWYSWMVLEIVWEERFQ